jgi:hypothetical protein
MKIAWPFRALEVERHRLLVAVQVLEVEAVPAAAHRIGVAAWFGRLLDLDHVGAPVGELAHRRRTRAMRGEIEDLDVGERESGHWIAPMSMKSELSS